MCYNDRKALFTVRDTLNTYKHMLRSFYFLGEVNGLITYDNDNKLWKVTDKRFPGEFATISKPYSSMLMGKATLDFENMNVSNVRS